MKTKQKSKLGFAAMLASALVLTGCAAESTPGETSTSGSDSTTPASDVVLTVAGWASSEQEDAALRAQLERFTAETGIKVEFQPSPDYDTTMQTAFASGQYANVFYVDSSKLPDWVDAGVVAAGDGLVENPEGIYQSLRDIFTVNGTFYCPSKDFATMGLQYNKDLFDAAGQDYPTADWTWTDLKTAADALTDPSNGVIGMVTPPDLARWLAFMHQAGGQLFDANGEFAFDSPEVLEALEYYASFARDGSGGSPSSVDAGWGGEAFGQGRAAMAMEGGWVMGYLLENFPDLNWGNVELPAGPAGKASMAFSVCFGVAAENTHPAESWQLVNFLTGEETQARLGDEGFGSMPSRAAAAEPYAQAWRAKAGNTGFDVAGVDGFIAGAAYGQRWQLPVGWGSFTQEFNANLERVFSGEITATEMHRTLIQLGNELAG